MFLGKTFYSRGEIPPDRAGVDGVQGGGLKVFCITNCVQDRTPIMLAIELLFRLHMNK